MSKRLVIGLCSAGVAALLAVAAIIGVHKIREELSGLDFDLEDDELFAE